MNRRELLFGGCAACLLMATRAALGNSAGDYAMPARLTRPDLASDEGGLWALMEREERQLRRSPFVLRDPELKSYVQDLACRLGGEHCPDIRVHLVRTPVFNANMAPNGMMQVWTGLLLRVDNEAQLAAVLGHEIGHYLQRHGLQRITDAKSKAAFGQFLGVFGIAGAVGQIAVLASAFAYGREHEREADRIGAQLMHAAGYDVREAAKVWNNLLVEIKARDGEDPGKNSPLFATHPSPPERQETLEQLARELPGGQTGEARYAKATQRFLGEWLQDEVKRGQHEETIALLSRHIERQAAPGRMRYYRGETYRLRNRNGDVQAALADYLGAAVLPDAPPETQRGIGLVQRQLGQTREARDAFKRYLALAPGAADAALINTYLAEMNP